MNSQQRKQARKQKRLINLGRDAAVNIAAAEAGAQHAHQQLANRDSALAAALGKAKTLEEAVMLARVEATKAAERARVELGEMQLVLESTERQAEARLAEQARVLNEGHRAHLQHIDSEHEAELASVRHDMANLYDRIAKLEAEAEEPTKLRRRLAEKQKHIEELQTEVSQLKLRVAPEPVHVPFINRRKAQ